MERAEEGGVITKQAPLVSRTLRRACRGKRCVACGSKDETVCGRHYNGLRQHMLGKGRGIKAHDFAVAQLCNACDAALTEGCAEGYNARLAHSEEFLFLCLLTLIERERGGLICVKGKG